MNKALFWIAIVGAILVFVFLKRGGVGRAVVGAVKPV